MAALRDLPLERLLEADAVAHELGLTASDRAEHHLRSRGYRVFAQIPALPSTVVGRIIERFGSLPALVVAVLMTWMRSTAWERAARRRS